MDIAVDLGSDRTRVFIENKGIVLDEASVVAFDVDTYDIVGVGNEAYKMIGKTPAGIRAMHPIDDGVISRSELVEDMVSILIKEVSPSKVTMLSLVLQKENGQAPEKSWEMISVSPGDVLTRSFGEFPKEENASTLSQILQAGVPEKYYLSQKACLGILRRASARGKELPELLKKALLRQASR